MAQEIDSNANDAEDGSTSVTRRARGRRPVAPPPKAPTPLIATAYPTAAKRPSRVAKPLRSIAILSMVGGLVATVALPAFAAARPDEGSVTIQQMAVDDAQAFVVASDASATELSREGYSATTAEEIEKKKAAEAAAERARIAATVAASAATSVSPGVPLDVSMISPGTGAVRWPLSGFTMGEGFGTRGGAHMGVDLLAPAGTPIYAAAAGVVRVSQESYGGYGVAVTIDHVINGQRAGSLYGHMTYGSRQVVSGQTVEVGQLIGFVGSTGRSTANHLHFEAYVNGSNVDPVAWLQANAG